MAYTKRPQGYTLEGVRIGTAGQRCLESLGCTVEHYIDRSDTACRETPYGTNAWRVRFPAGVKIHEPSVRTTASGNKRRSMGSGKKTPRKTWGAMWEVKDEDLNVSAVHAKWISSDLSGLLPTVFTEIKKDGELVSGSSLHA